MTLVTYCLIGAIVTLVLAHKLRDWVNMLKIARKFSSPSFPLPILGHIHKFIFVTPENAMERLSKLCAASKSKMTAVFLGTKPVYFLFHPETVEPLLKSSVQLAKSPEYGVFAPWFGDGLAMSCGQKWRQRRQMLTPAFHKNALSEAITVVNDKADTLIDIIEQESGEGDKASKLDVHPLVTRCLQEIVFKTLLDKDLELQRDPGAEYCQNVIEMQRILHRHQSSPVLSHDAIFKLTPWASRSEKISKDLKSFALAIVTQRKKELERDRESGSNERNFLDVLIGNGVDDAEIVDEINTFTSLGHMSTSSALSWTLLMLAKHPEVQQRAYEEQLRIFGEDYAEAKDAVTKGDLERMRYLECCVKETLRLYPVLPFFGRQLEEDLEIEGKTIPRRSDVVVFPYLLHRNPDVWSEPDEFNPCRFNNNNR